MVLYHLDCANFQRLVLQAPFARGVTFDTGFEIYLYQVIDQLGAVTQGMSDGSIKIIKRQGQADILVEWFSRRPAVNLTRFPLAVMT